jgi:hypothetical protein
VVEREDAAGSVAPRQHDDREVAEAELEVGVLLVDPGRDGVLLGFEGHHLKPVGGQVLEIRTVGGAPEALPDQPVDLSAHRRGEHQGSGFLPQHIPHARAAIVVVIGGGNDRAGADDEGHRVRARAASRWAPNSLNSRSGGFGS